jgi:hypothetical protein
MTRHDLVHENLTVLPKRFETRRWGRGGGNINIALVGQSNFNLQAVGVGAFVIQDNYQQNIAVVNQH